MHIVISWDIRATGRQREVVHKALTECLSGYSWVKPLTTLYIVKIDDESERESIRTGLIEVCRQYPGTANLLISPAMQGGTYSGYLPRRLWPKIRMRTEAE